MSVKLGSKQKGKDKTVSESEKLKEKLKNALAEVADLTAQRQGDLEVINHYKQENEALKSTNENLQKQMKRFQQVTHEDVSTLNDEYITMKESTAITIQQLTEKNIELQSQVEGYKVLDDEVRRMRHRVDALMQALEEEGKEHTDEVNKLKQDTFTQRYNLEQAFRKRIAELQEEFKREAFDEMEEESKKLYIKNLHLHNEIDIQKQGIEKMLGKHRMYEMDLRDKKKNLSLAQEENGLLTEKLVSIKDKNRKLRLKIDELKEEYIYINIYLLYRNAKLQEEVNQCRELKAENDELQDRIIQILDELKHSDGNLEKWRYRALEATRLATLHKKIPGSYYKTNKRQISQNNYSMDRTATTTTTTTIDDRRRSSFQDSSV